MSQLLKPETVAKKLDVLAMALPDEIRHGHLTREQFEDLQANPPEWLVTLRRDGPHPRNVVAARLGVSKAGLLRAGVTEPLTTDEIRALIDDPPQWLIAERAVAETVQREEQRIKRQRETGA